METAEAIAWLRARSKESTAATYARHGVRRGALGVSYADIDALAKHLKRDHAKARELWASELHEARIVATKIADPAALTDAEADRWLADVDCYPLSGALGDLLGAWSDVVSWSSRWIADPREWPSATAWSAIARAALSGAVPVDTGRALLLAIRDGLVGAPNRTRYSMNGALIAIGSGLPELRAEAVAIAKALGPVEVDHGQTSCKTPDAVVYLAKMDARGAAPKKSSKKSSPKDAKTSPRSKS